MSAVGFIAGPLRVAQWMALAGVSAVVFAGSLWQAEAWNRHVVIEAAHRSGTITAMSYSMLLQSDIDKLRLVPFILAHDPDVRAALAAPAAQPGSTGASAPAALAAARVELNRKLAVLADGTTADIIFLMDASGTVVASSDSNRPEHVLGRNFGYRAYYAHARAAGTGEDFERGAVDHQPDFFLSQRITAQGRFLGVVVVKVAFQTLQHQWARSGARVLVVDGNGVVLVTDVPAWLFCTIAPLPETLRTRLRARFGAVALAPLPFTVVDGRHLLAIGAERFVAVTAPVPDTEWTVYFLAPRDMALCLSEGQLCLLAGLVTIFVFGLMFVLRARLRSHIIMERLAVTDSLTQLLNRRALESVLDQEWRRAERTGMPLAAIMIDVDHFKLFNDRYGHPAGDECLRSIAGVLRDSAKRSGDAVARYGGEEFLLLLPNTDAQGAVALAEAILTATRALAIRHETSPAGGTVTISIGVAALTATDVAGPESLISATDIALYRAKHTGRDRIACLRPGVTSDEDVWLA